MKAKTYIIYKRIDGLKNELACVDKEKLADSLKYYSAIYGKIYFKVYKTEGKA